MDWIDIAGIVFVCVTMNHLGLISATEKVLERELPIVNCAKCSSFWLTLFYSLVMSRLLILSLAVSFLASYVALWLELFEAYIDTLYLKVYEKVINSDSDDTAAASPDEGCSAVSVSKL